MLDSRASSRSLSALCFSRCLFSVSLPLFLLLDKLGLNEWEMRLHFSPSLCVSIILHAQWKHGTASTCCPTERSFVITFFLLTHRLFCHKQSQASFPAPHIRSGGRGMRRDREPQQGTPPCPFCLFLFLVMLSLKRPK